MFPCPAPVCFPCWCHAYAFSWQKKNCCFSPKLEPPPNWSPPFSTQKNSCGGSNSGVGCTLKSMYELMSTTRVMTLLLVLTSGCVGSSRSYTIFTKNQFAGQANLSNGHKSWNRGDGSDSSKEQNVSESISPTPSFAYSLVKPFRNSTRQVSKTVTSTLPIYL